MIELFIIRHGLAGKPLEDSRLDQERPLTKKGKDRMKDIAKSLDGAGISFDAVVSSPLARAKETAEIIDRYCGNGNNVAYTDLLKPGSSFDGLIDYLNGLGQKDMIAIVGHEPFLSEFASYCLSRDRTSYIKLKKGGVLAMETGGSLKPGQCKLTWLMEPWQLVELS